MQALLDWRDRVISGCVARNQGRTDRILAASGGMKLAIVAVGSRVSGTTTPWAEQERLQAERLAAVTVSWDFARSVCSCR